MELTAPPLTVRVPIIALVASPVRAARTSLVLETSALLMS